MAGGTVAAAAHGAQHTECQSSPGHTQGAWVLGKADRWCALAGWTRRRPPPDVPKSGSFVRPKMRSLEALAESRACCSLGGGAAAHGRNLEAAPSVPPEGN